MKDYIEIKKWTFYDVFDIVKEFPIVNEVEWERWVEPHNYRSHLIAIVPNPKNDPWGRPMLPYVTKDDKTPKMWHETHWPHPPLDDMNREECITVTSVNGKAVRLWRRTSDWVDPWRRAEKRKDDS